MAGLALGSLAGSGCALFNSNPTPSPNNPMNTGRVPTARKFATDPDTERRPSYRRQPGSRSGDAPSIPARSASTWSCAPPANATTWSRRTPGRITLEGTGPSYRTQDFVLRARAPSRFAPTPRRANSLLGLAAQACELAGKCSEAAVNRAVYSGQKFVALTGGGVICFANPFKETTNYARLRLEDKRTENNALAERVFVWEFR